MAVPLSTSGERQLYRTVCVAAALGFVLAWASLVPRPMVMDDYFFFHFLEKMSFWEGLWQRVTGNWGFEFVQALMYRPVAGLLQVAVHHGIGAWAPGHRLLSLGYHATACVLAARLALALGLGRRGSAAVLCLTLLQCGSVEAVAWPFSFYDPLAEALLLLALLQVTPVLRRPWLALGLLFLALGCKETMVPMAPVLAASFWLGDTGPDWKRLRWPMLCLPPLLLYLGARTLAVGHPLSGLQGEGGITAVGSGVAASAWTLDVLLAAAAGGLALDRMFGARRGKLLFLSLWVGLSLAPGIHFSVQITGTPTLLSPRYLYAAIFPLALLSVSVATQPGTLALAAGTVLTALAFPRSLRLLALPAGMLLGALFFGVSPGRLRQRQIVAALAVMGLGLGLWQRLEARRLQASEAGTVREAFAAALQGLDPRLPVAVLGLRESAVEPNGAFNGDLQWVLQPPFLADDLAARCYSAYPRWDSPPTNRFADLGTPALVKMLRAGGAVELLRFDGGRLVRLGQVRLEDAGPANLPPLDAWGALGQPLEPSRIAAIGFDVTPGATGAIALEWRSERHPDGWRVPVVEAAEAGRLAGSRVWLPLGDQVDWLLGGPLLELRLSGSGAQGVSGVHALAPGDAIPPAALAQPAYQFPDRDFLLIQPRLVEPRVNGS